VAYREMGFTASGIADLMGSTVGTVRNYLDTVADQYGVTAVQPTPAGDRGRLSEPEVRVDMDAPTGRCVVVAGNDTHVDAERYYRTWEREGRVQRDRKLAVRFPDFDDQRNDRLGAMEWDEHHVRYDDEYQFGRRDVVETGAWTLDGTRETIRALRERSVSVPKLSAHPVVDVDTWTLVDDHIRADIHVRSVIDLRGRVDAGKQRLAVLVSYRFEIRDELFANRLNVGGWIDIDRSLAAREGFRIVWHDKLHLPFALGTRRLRNQCLNRLGNRRRKCFDQTQTFYVSGDGRYLFQQPTDLEASQQQ
jgi:hypothetical protein